MFRFPSKHNLKPKEKLKYIRKYIKDNPDLKLDDFRDIRKKLVKICLNDAKLNERRRLLLLFLNMKIDNLRSKG